MHPRWLRLAFAGMVLAVAVILTLAEINPRAAFLVELTAVVFVIWWIYRNWDRFRR